ncbi:uL30 family ribosomal protein [Candidatus Nanohalovita haloferacivicina]|uniref:uL30 family ribosomal protein n=1 Tax=Candidatus Nanohalovita haloferacivicina TaxID=2978046 RepID=UPI00325FA6FF|nr:Ribosomal protein L30 [Candidatus Nanohalobia archaeon BNXNv]
MIAAIRIRGDVDASDKVSATLQNVNLHRRNQCVVYEDTESIKGMFNKAKDYITYGEVSEETLELLEERKGSEIESGDVINLSPPSRGYKDTKKNVNQGGSLGKRENLDNLIEKMV